VVAYKAGKSSVQVVNPFVGLAEYPKARSMYIADEDCKVPQLIPVIDQRVSSPVVNQI